MRAIRLVLVAIVVFALSGCLLGPIEGEGPLRYRDHVFGSVVTTADQVYGSAVAQDGTPVTLRYDLREPAGDDADVRPLVIFVHGGSFRSGSRTSGEIVDQATDLSRKGYVTASISYRLSAQGCTVINAACIESIVDATEDAQAAVRYFRANAASFRIDPDRIAISGTSAGAITALNVGYGAVVPGNSGTPGPSSAVRAAVSLSGARLLGTCDAGDAPALLFHGSSDFVVPYAWAQSTISCARDGGTWSRLITWSGEGHVPYVAHRQEVIDTQTTFLFHSLQVGFLLI